MIPNCSLTLRRLAGLMIGTARRYSLGLLAGQLRARSSSELSSSQSLRSEIVCRRVQFLSGSRRRVVDRQLVSATYIQAQHESGQEAALLRVIWTLNFTFEMSATTAGSVSPSNWDGPHLPRFTSPNSIFSLRPIEPWRRRKCACAQPETSFSS